VETLQPTVLCWDEHEALICYIDFLDFTVLKFLRGTHNVSNDDVCAVLFDVDDFSGLDFTVKDYVKFTHTDSQ
jgi:hypothetical protein